MHILARETPTDLTETSLKMALEKMREKYSLGEPMIICHPENAVVAGRLAERLSEDDYKIHVRVTPAVMDVDAWAIINTDPGIESFSIWSEGA